MPNMNQHSRLQPQSHEDEETPLLFSQASTNRLPQRISNEEDAANPVQSPFGRFLSLMDILTPDEWWMELYILASSANFHVGQCLHYFVEYCKELDDIPIASQGNPPRSRNQKQMKRSCNIAIRDLLALEMVLAHAKNLRMLRKPNYSLFLALCAAVCFIYAIMYAVILPNILGKCIVFVFYTACGVAVMPEPSVWHWQQGRKLDRIRDAVQKLRRNLQDNISAVEDTDRNILNITHYMFIRAIFQDS